MAQRPVADDAADRALQHLVDHLYDIELSRLAYARPGSENERRYALAATREIARRATLAEAESRAQQIAPSPRAPSRAPARRDRRIRRRRTRSVTGLLTSSFLLSALVAVSTVDAPPHSPAPPSSLQLLYRNATVEESRLRTQLIDDGLQLTVGPRVIAEAGAAQIVAYRYVSIGTADSRRNEVCVLLIDIGAPTLPRCTDRTDFLVDGFETTLVSDAASYALLWRPSAPPTVTASPSEADRPRVPSPAASDAVT